MFTLYNVRYCLIFIKIYVHNLFTIEPGQIISFPTGFLYGNMYLLHLFCKPITDED